MNQKGFANFIVIGLVIVVFSVAGYFILVRKPPNLRNETQQAVTTSNSTSDTEQGSTASWQAYQNEKYRFELKYPSDFKIKLEEPTAEEEKKQKLLLTLNIEDPKAQVLAGRTNGLIIFIWKNDSSYDSLFQGPFPRESSTEIGTVRVVKRIINNIDGIEVTSTAHGGNVYGKEFYFKNSSIVWNVHLDLDSRYAEISQEQEILSSLRLTK